MGRYRKREDRQYRKIRLRLIILLVLAGLILAAALLAPWIVPHDPYEPDVLHVKENPSFQFLLGTDRLGRDVLSRVLIGGRITIFASLLLTAISFLIGTILGVTAGYAGGITDGIIMRITDACLALPQMIIAIAVAGVLGGSLKNAMFAIGVTSWTGYARVARSHVLSEKEKNYISAARMSGRSSFFIICRHIIPNIIQPLIMNALTQIGITMLGIAGLSFLGLGVVPPQAEWGSMINDGRAYLQLAPWAVIGPSAATVLTVIIFNLLGDAFIDYGNARRKS